MPDIRNFPKPGAAKPPSAKRGLGHTLRYFNRFGLRAGMQVARVRRHSANPLAVRLPDLAHPLWVRPGTADVATFDEVFVAREYELPITNFSPLQILDLGANVGYASIIFATRWPQASILAIEPDVENMKLLKRNTGPYRQINALHAAVWSRPASVVIANPSDDANAFQMAETKDHTQAKIPAFTISQLMDRLGCAQLDLLKLDVEGAEAGILQGAGEWMDRVNVMVIELHDRLVSGCGEALCAALNGRRFALEIVGHNLVIDFRPTPYLRV